jgi:hypothetical protein
MNRLHQRPETPQRLHPGPPHRAAPPRTPPAWATTLALAAGCALIGCGDNATGPGSTAPGTFSAQVSGAVTGSFSGIAAFGSMTDFQGGSVFVLVLEDQAGTRELGLIKEIPGRPGTGSFPIGEYLGSPLYGEFIADGPSGSRFFLTGSGTLTITASSAQSLQGSVTLNAREQVGSATVQVTATFNAMCIPGMLTCD